MDIDDDESMSPMSPMSIPVEDGAALEAVAVAIDIDMSSIAAVVAVVFAPGTGVGK